MQPHQTHTPHKKGQSSRPPWLKISAAESGRVRVHTHPTHRNTGRGCRVRVHTLSIQPPTPRIQRDAQAPLAITPSAAAHSGAQKPAGCECTPTRPTVTLEGAVECEYTPTQYSPSHHEHQRDAQAPPAIALGAAAHGRKTLHLVLVDLVLATHSLPWAAGQGYQAATLQYRRTSLCASEYMED